MFRRARTRIDDLVTWCRHTATAADRGWKATALGVAIVLLTVFVL
ncbi:hypothetical protein [Halobellus rarus]|uniref:Uncharacterized protein n=1 Tax=Halobellus rarus TaxID=1126237 RepID=A0ABD6CNN6_9EURY|nr:hypothetical protein [Halobellus rarus]